MPTRPANVQFETLITPAEAVSAEHDDNVPPLAVSVIVCDEEVTTLPPESSTLTTGWVENAAPEAAATGWVEKSSCVAAPVVTVMFDEAADVKPSPLKVKV